MLSHLTQTLWVVTLGAASLAATPDPIRNAAPPGAAPASAPSRDEVLFSDDFSTPSLERWKPDREGVWSVRYGALRADLPDERQERSLIFAGGADWADYAVDLDVCAMRGVDKGVVVRIDGQSGIGVDLRGPGYHDVVMHRREWPMGRASVVNGNGTWHHLRVEAQGHRYRVFVDGKLTLDRPDRRKSRPNGSIALAAYTGGGGECTVYYDNIVVTRLADSRAQILPR